MSETTNAQELEGGHLGRLNSFMLEKVYRKDALIERQLYGSKHKVYYQLHPVEATQVFTHIYVRVFVEMWSKYIDRNSKPKLGFSGDMFQTTQKVVTGLWRARQAADALGVPYEFYIREAMEKRLRWGLRTQLPRANDLYSQSVLAHVYERWKEFNDGARKDL